MNNDILDCKTGGDAIHRLARNTIGRPSLTPPTALPQAATQLGDILRNSSSD